MQVVWGYDRDIDLDTLKRFHGNLAHGLLGRRIERSPLPFGRYRWVCDGLASELDIIEKPRPRTEFSDWLDECARQPLDPESGPGWRLSVRSFTDGSTAVSLVMSHYVIDGIGGVVAVVMAILGDTSGQGYPPPRSRPLVRAVLEDAIGAVQEAPALVRALRAAIEPIKQARLRRDGPTTAQPIATASTGGDTPADVPGVWVRLNMDEWEARATALGGSGSTLATALTAKLGERLGRARDGNVNMLLVVNDRKADDTRAVAVSFARFSIDPAIVTTDLRVARASIKQALKTLRDTPDPSAALAPLTPFTPKRAWKEMVDSGLDDPDPPAVCSSLGEVGPVVIRPDGNPCDYAYLRGIDQLLTQRRLEQMGSHLQLFFGCGIEANKVGLHIRAYQPGLVTTKRELHELVERTLAEFELAGVIE
ncbi:hypothetical protein PDG61_31235 [Mycolicibacterium sp. BiH015]|uniref:hypothetical protein n=1 Tax=Mycolicibacterium sp. BiH015 TaxID=3018808 RepID=UPI0022E3E583|nr:hypothetical protein [Mycolicibacterium sp. BiH015]MDA2895420.1 hypothetical protein [Mycolicibacterium sp. BiH015]